MAVMIFVTLLHVPLCLIFVEVFEMDITGLSFAMLVNKLMGFMILMVYGNCSERIKPAL
jgi:Na+-driven multidrug efflux pump